MIFFNIIGATKSKRTNLFSRLNFNKTIIRGTKSAFEECVLKFGGDICKKTAKNHMGELAVGVLQQKNLSEKKQEFSKGVQSDSKRIQEEIGDKPQTSLSKVLRGQPHRGNAGFLDRAKMAADQKRFKCTEAQYQELTERIKKKIVKIDEPTHKEIHNKFALKDLIDGSLYAFTKCKKWFDPITKLLVYPEICSPRLISNSQGVKGMSTQQGFDINPSTKTVDISGVEITTLDLPSVEITNEIKELRKKDSETVKEVLDPEIKSMDKAKVQKDIRVELTKDALEATKWFSLEKEKEREKLEMAKMAKEDKKK